MFIHVQCSMSRVPHFERKHPSCCRLIYHRLRLPLRVLRNGGSRGGWWDSKCASCTRVLCGPVL